MVKVALERMLRPYAVNGLGHFVGFDTIAIALLVELIFQLADIAERADHVALADFLDITHRKPDKGRRIERAGANLSSWRMVLRVTNTRAWKR
jgi:hypothetical protein